MLEADVSDDTMLTFGGSYDKVHENGVGDGLHQNVRIDRLQQVAERTPLQGLHRGFHGGQAGHEQHRQIGIELVGAAHHLQAVGAGHGDVRHHHVHVAGIEHAEVLAGGAAVSDANHLVPGALQGAAQRAQEVVVVVRDQDATT